VNIATGSNRVVLGLRPRGAAAHGGREEEEMADVEEQEVTGEGRDVMMTETETEIATTTPTDTETEIAAGALGTNDWSDPAHLCQVIGVDHCGTRNRGRTQGGCSVLAGAT